MLHSDFPPVPAPLPPMASEGRGGSAGSWFVPEEVAGAGALSVGLIEEDTGSGFIDDTPPASGSTLEPEY